MHKNLIGALLASSLTLTALAGCQATVQGAITPGTVSRPGGSQTATNPATPGNTNPPPANNNPGTVQPVKPAPTVTNTVVANAAAQEDSGTETAAAMAEERDMDDFMTMAAQEEATASFYLLAADTKLDARATAEATVKAKRPNAEEIKQIAVKVRTGVKLSDDEKQKAKNAIVKVAVEVRTKVKAAFEAHAKKIEKRLDKFKDQRQDMRGKLQKAAWVDNGDGTSSKKIEIDHKRSVNGKEAVRHCIIVKTIDTESKQLLSVHAEFTQSLPGGLTRTSTRDKNLQEDGSYLIVFHSELTMPGGAVRTVDWEKTISADGSEIKGKGTITWVKGDKTATRKVEKTVSLTLSGNEDKPKCKADDNKAEVTLNEDGNAAVTTEAGATTTVEADSAAVDVNADAGASAAADASASATVNL